jgi:hypothetical protein
MDGIRDEWCETADACWSPKAFLSTVHSNEEYRAAQSYLTKAAFARCFTLAFPLFWPARTKPTFGCS